MSCKARKAIFGVGDVTCCLAPHAEGKHRWQAAFGGLAMAAEWDDRPQRIRDSELNGLRVVLAPADGPQANPAEIGLALAGWLSERPEVLQAMLQALPESARQTWTP